VEEDSIWEDNNEIAHKYPEFILKNKMEEGMLVDIDA
jgi:hypothetical protein